MNISNEVIRGLQKDVSETRKDINEIKTALLGNEYNPEGYIKRQYDTEAEVNEIKNDIKKIFWTAAGISGGVSGIIGLIIFVLKIFNKG